MVKTVCFILCDFYHNKKKFKKGGMAGVYQANDLTGADQAIPDWLV